MNNTASPYFLQEAIDLGLSAINNRLDSEQNNRPYFMIELSETPKLIHDIWDMSDMCSRYADAFILGRQVTGNPLYKDTENDIRTLLYNSDPYAEPFMAGRMLIAYVDLFLKERSVESQMRVTRLIELIKSKLTYEDDYAFFFKAPDGWTSKSAPIFGSFQFYPTYPIGGVMLALARYLEEVNDKTAEEMLERLTIFVLNKSGVFDADGAYYGHTHSGGILTSAAAIFRRSLYTGSFERVNHMMKTLEWTLSHCSSWGWVPDGLGSPDPSCETCSITDALHYILLAAKYVNPAYYDVAERFARNQLMGNQFNSVSALPIENSKPNEQIIKAVIGSWASWSLPNSLDNGLEHIEGCCLGSGIRGCFLVWENVIEYINNTVIVNMGISRNSPWAEIKDYKPWQGRTDVIMHKPASLKLKLPDYVDFQEFTLLINDKPAPIRKQRGNYALIDRLFEGDRVSLNFPLDEQTTLETISGTEYAVTWHGNNVTDINPKGTKYPLYNHIEINNAGSFEFASKYRKQTGGPIHY